MPADILYKLDIDLLAPIDCYNGGFLDLFSM